MPLFWQEAGTGINCICPQPCNSMRFPGLRNRVSPSGGLLRNDPMAESVRACLSLYKAEFLPMNHKKGSHLCNYSKDQSLFLR